jgi:urease alpha subunit
MIEPVVNCRNISKRDMKHNNTLPKMTGKSHLDGLTSD